MHDDVIPQTLPSLLPRLWRFALRLTANTHDAEDLVQRACVRALEKRHQFAPGTSALSWLFSIVHSIWLTELRSRNLQNRYTSPLSDELVETLADPLARDPEVNALHRQLIASVDALPDAQRAVMLLIAAEGMSYSEAADTLGIPIGTVMSRLSRARLTIGLAFGKPSATKTNNKGAAS